MRSDEIKKIMKEKKEAFEMLEEYDRTHILPTKRIRIDVTISSGALKKVKEIKEKTGKPISRIIEEAIIKYLKKE